MFGTPLPSSTVDVITMKSATVNLRDGSQYDPLITSNARVYLSTIAIGQVTASNLTSTVLGLGSIPYLSSYAIYGSNDAGYVLKSTVQGLASSLSTGYTTITTATISSTSEFISVYSKQSTFLFATGTAVGQSTIQYSFNGSNWNSISTGGFQYGANAIGYSKNAWVATGQYDGSASELGSIQFSFDGVNWNNNRSGGIRAGKCVGTTDTLTFVGGLTASRSASGSIQYSSDFITWNSNLTGGFAGNDECRCFSLNGPVLLAGGYIYDTPNVNGIQYSTDGCNWNVNVSGSSGGTFGIAWNGSYWVSVGRGIARPQFSIQISRDGSNWFNCVSGGFSNYGSAVAWNGSMWVAVGVFRNNSFSNQNIQYSYDGSNWFNSVSGAFFGGDDPSGNYGGGGTGIVWDQTNSMWVATGIVGSSQLNTIKYSYDGSNWFNIVSGGFTGASIFRATSIAVYPYSNINDITTNTLNFSLSGQPYDTTKTQHQIVASISTLSFDTTLFLNNYTSTVGINTSNTTAILTVAGSAVLQTLSVSSFVTINTLSSIRSASGYGRLYYNPTTKTMTVGSINV
jgi:hypothetical protein